MTKRRLGTARAWILVVIFALTATVMTGCILIDIIFGEIYFPGQRVSHSVGAIEFHMRLAPGMPFPYGTEDGGMASVQSDFWIAETQVTYNLWYEVKEWAVVRGYTFANEGTEGSFGITGEEPTARRNEPVTRVNWHDCIVWCNALSEYKGYTPVYVHNNSVIKDATREYDAVARNVEGFRLPTCDEWELAARYKGDDASYGAIEFPVGSGNYWTPGNYASGARADYENTMVTKDVAWYEENSDGKTQEVGRKPSTGNWLGLYDMSGNVFEWCFEWYPDQPGTHKVNRGGSWDYGASDLQVGSVDCAEHTAVSGSHGFRIVRTYQE